MEISVILRFRLLLSARVVMACALGVLATSAACVGLKDDEAPAATRGDDDAGNGPRTNEGGVDGGRGGESDGAPRTDSGAADGGASIAAVPDRRAAADFSKSADNETVKDAATGLVWQLVRSPSPYAFPDARALCDEAIIAGKDDWRLPTKIELLSLADYGSTETTSLPPIFAPDVVSFWSADEVLYVLPTHPVWMVNFVTPGSATRAPNPAESILARCVRGPKLSRATFVDEGALVRDVPSGRLWQKVRAGGEMNVSTAVAHCAGLSIDGKTGFRLPSVKELLSTLDDTLPAAPHDDAVFSAPRGGVVLTGTPMRGSATGVVGIELDTGRLAQATTGFVRCVR